MFDWTLTIPGIDFEIPANILVLGLLTGLTYALTGVGLTLVFRTSRVLNLAAGEMGSLPALLIPVFVIGHSWPYWPTLAMALVGSAVLGGLIEFLVVRRLQRATRLTAMVATIGLAQVLFGLTFLLPRAGELTGQRYPTPFTWRYTVGSLVLGPGHILILIVSPLCVLGLAWFLRRSRIGRASRAAAENTDAARLAGVPTSRIAFVIWMLAGLLAGIGAMLIGPTRPLAIGSALGPALLLRALAASMIGGLTSLPGTFGGGIVIGIIEALILFNYPVGGVLELVLAVVILASLLLERRLSRAYRRREDSTWARASAAQPLTPDLAGDRRVRIMRWSVLGLVVALAVTAPLVMSPSNQFRLTSVLMFALIGLSLVILTGYSGNVSLGQWAFVGLGAAVGGRLVQLEWPYVAAMFGAAVCGGIAALIVGLPALRIRGLFLAVTTLSFALVVSTWLFYQDWLVVRAGQSGSSLQLPRPEFFGVSFDDERNYYWLCLAVFMAIAYVVYRLRRSGLGRAMVAVRENAPSAASLAISPRRAKLMAFVLSGTIASLGGFLYGNLRVNFANDPAGTFGPTLSLDIMVTAVFGGVSSITGVALGAIWVEGIPSILGEGYALVSSGLGLLVVLILLPGGLASLVFNVRDRWVAALTRGRRVESEGAPAEPETEDAVETGEVAESPREPARVATSTLAGAATRAAATNGAIPVRAEGVTVNFGGLRALDAVTVEARNGEILGLMGPNGAGKTTLFDVLTGQVRSDAGRVVLDGRDIGGLPSHKRARLGLGRTHQQALLFGELTVCETIEVALERRRPSHLLPSLVGFPTARRRDRTRRADAVEVIDLLDLGPYAHRPLAELPTGIRRLVELGCVVALDAHVLLLDEPTAGFTPREVESFARVIGDVQRYLGATIVVIDHDVPMMRHLVDRLYVLSTGRVIAEGPPTLLDTDQGVAEAYLGIPTPVA